MVVWKKACAPKLPKNKGADPLALWVCVWSPWEMRSTVYGLRNGTFSLSLSLCLTPLFFPFFLQWKVCAFEIFSLVKESVEVAWSFCWCGTRNGLSLLGLPPFGGFPSNHAASSFPSSSPSLLHISTIYLWLALSLGTFACILTFWVYKGYSTVGEEWGIPGEKEWLFYRLLELELERVQLLIAHKRAIWLFKEKQLSFTGPCFVCYVHTRPSSISQTLIYSRSERAQAFENGGLQRWKI